MTVEKHDRHGGGKQMVTEDTLKVPDFRSFPNKALLIGAVGVFLCLVALFVNATAFYRAYLLAYVFWFNIALGSLLILMIQHLTGGAWGLMIRRVLESAVRTLPLMTLLFIPIIIGLFTTHLYEWTDQELMRSDPVLRQKLPYLNPAGFVIRAIIYFAIWNALGFLLSSWSLRHDETADHRLLGKMARLSGPGIVLYALTITFASVDWLMSLEPHWYSTIYGAMMGIGQLLSAMAFVIATIIILARYRPLSTMLHAGHLHDLGKLLLAFIMLWAYLSFSQLIITWSGNLSEEVPWYLRRFNGGYQWVAIIMVIAHFVLPFMLLLSRDLKRNPRTLLWIAIWVVAARIIDLYWLINPAAGHGNGHGAMPHINSSTWMDLVALPAVGGIWLAAFVKELKKRPLIPRNDPYLEEALANHGH